ncbi:pantoate--beta-alanine ligase [Dictyobacter aurantiacus]|uniref:Pantothenate synthetase n=1 Tax=Dictyobacter aurantiacus TaxID=1936993 RepID=A0A401ZHC1_9CHLR|nr:pantoate--beta-alanine ligase [Dictyobacter aurantiacus]GCE06259.1 pantothenate synthetase [Dictyobacter aurantiacus]
MHIVRTVQAMRHEHEQWTGSVGLVPTMGYLHRGHLSLVEHARAENEHVVVSIFVNPTQFGQHEDLASYPRDIEHDLQLLSKLGVDVVFLPTVDEMYPSGFTTYVTPEGPLVEQGEGAIRPGHFRGVATVVLKLFLIIQPQRVYFGQKDAQQVVVIRRMIEDLNLPITMQTLPTIREADGLAMSSRNSYLTSIERARAPVLYRALSAAMDTFDPQHPANAQDIIQAAREIVDSMPDIRLEYIEIRDYNTFLPLQTLRPPALLLIAVRIGKTRLIDNFVLHTDGRWDTGLIGDQLSHANP